MPVWERAVSLAAEGCYPGGLKNNRRYLEEKVTADGVGPDELLPLYDPQTSGGLLVAVPERRARAFVRALEAYDALAAVIGEVTEAQNDQGHPVGVSAGILRDPRRRRVATTRAISSR